MLLFTLAIQCDNAAFDPSPHPEIAHILRAIADAVEAGVEMGSTRDTNGNTVGEFILADS